MGDGGAAHGELGEERLDVADLGRALGAGGRIADVADRERARQRLHQRGGGEVVADVAEAAGGGEAVLGRVGDDPARLLAAMLQCMQAEGDEVGGLLDADDAEDAALLVQLVVVGRQDGQGHGASGGGLARYIEAAPAVVTPAGGLNCRCVSAAAVVLAGDPLRRVDRQHRGDALLEAGEDLGAVAVVDLRHAAGRRRRVL